MRFGPKILLAVGLIATVTAVGFWLARVFQTPGELVQAAPEMGTEATPLSSPAGPERTGKPAQAGQQTESSPVTPAAELTITAQPAAGTNLLPDWQDKVDEVLRLDAQPSEVGKKFLEMLPQLPAEGRVEALQHAVNLLADADYEPIGKMFTDPKVTEDEIEILIRDVLNRSNAIKLPLLLQVARTPGHIKAGESREILEVFLGEDYGQDWDKWQSKLDEFLKENSEVTDVSQAP
jgi:hypothetical protein